MNKQKQPSILGKLRVAKSHLENHDWSRDLIQDWKNYISLPAYRQIVIRKQWDEYYAKSWETIAYQRFSAQKEAMRKAVHPKTPIKDRMESKQKVKDYAEDARMQLVSNDFELTKPEGRDPWEYDYNNFILEYKKIEKKIKEEMLNEI